MWFLDIQTYLTGKHPESSPLIISPLTTPQYDFHPQSRHNRRTYPNQPSTLTKIPNQPANSGQHKASGNLGAPITAALAKAGFDVTIITRAGSTATFPGGIPVIRIRYTPEDLTRAMAGQDGVVCAVGPAGLDTSIAMVDAAEAAGVRRFVVNDFGWGPGSRGLPEFDDIHVRRRAQWDRARERAEGNRGFTWTGITSGNPIDWVSPVLVNREWFTRYQLCNEEERRTTKTDGLSYQALRRFPLMGFDVTTRSATIYDRGEEYFTGTTLQGIAQAVVGVLERPEETANRFVRVLSIRTCQNELLQAFRDVTAARVGGGCMWDVRRSTTEALMERGRRRHRAGEKGWVLELAVAQMFDVGEARNVVASSREESDSELLGVAAETAQQVVAKVLEIV